MIGNVFISILCLIAASAFTSCTPMIENGRDHRHDSKFKDDGDGQE